DVTVWLDVCTPDGDDMALIEEEFGLHALAIEDAQHVGQRPKLDHYASHLFLSAYAIALPPGGLDLASSELAIFITQNAVITVRKHRDFDIDEVTRRWDDSPDLA